MSHPLLAFDRCVCPLLVMAPFQFVEGGKWFDRTASGDVMEVPPPPPGVTGKVVSVAAAGVVEPKPSGGTSGPGGAAAGAAVDQDTTRGRWKNTEPDTCFRGSGSAPTPVPRPVCTVGYAPMPVNPKAVLRSAAAVAAMTPVDLDKDVEMEAVGMSKPMPSGGTSGPGGAAAGAADGGAGDREPFDGASGAAQAVPDELRCSDCGAQHFWHTWFANLHEDNSFAKVGNVKLHQVLERTHGDFNNKKAASIREVCAVCCGKHHGRDDYWTVVVSDDGSEILKPTSTFSNLAKKSKGQNRGSKKLDFMIKGHDEKQMRKQALEAGPPVQAKDVYEAMTRSNMFRVALDWIVEISCFCYFFYGCSCGLYPIHSGKWWRLVRQILELKAGLTTASSDQAKWFCGSCLSPWSWGGDGFKRLFVIGDFGGDTARYPPLLGYVGQTEGTSAEGKIQFLKGCQMLRQLQGREITYDHIIQVINEVNDRATKKLTKALKETRVVTAVDPSSNEKLWNYKVYCENTTLSLSTPGTRYHCIDTKMSTQHIEEFTADELNELLDFCAACLDIDSAPSSALQPAQKKARNTILWDGERPNPRFHGFRQRLVEISRM